MIMVTNKIELFNENNIILSENEKLNIGITARYPHIDFLSLENIFKKPLIILKEALLGKSEKRLT